MVVFVSTVNYTLPLKQAILTYIMSAFDTAYAQLNTAQKSAVDCIDGPVLVLAGPGTGKTQLLALRAANILTKTDTLPQNILCLTFTDVGARNMRERLQRYIGKSAYDVKIGTYHAFGSDLIRSHRDYFEDLAGSQPVDALGQHELMSQVYASVPSTNPLWRSDIYLRDALAFVSEAKRGALTPDDVRAIANSNIRYIDAVSPQIAGHLAGFSRMSKTSIDLFRGLLDILVQHHDERTIDGIKPLYTLAVFELQTALEACASSGKTNELTAWKNVWLCKNTDNQFGLSGKKEALKLRGAADIYEAYQAALTEAELFDYDDMILRAIERIEAYDDLRFGLHEQYQYIMLDEFQDTNPSQLKLIQLLTNNPLSEGRPNVLAVGDDDQAIYAFQGADYMNMSQFAKLYDGTKLITLTENWRSHADIIGTAKGVMRQIEARLTTALGLPDKDFVAANPHLPKKAAVERRHFQSDPAQSAWLASHAKQLAEQGVQLDQIAIIAPQHKYLEPLVPFLHTAGLPVRYDKRENVLDDPHITQLYIQSKLVLALAAGDQELADAFWPEVLSADHWGLSTSQIWQLSWLASKNRYNPQEPAHWQALMMQDPDLKPIALFFARISQIISVETLESVLDYLTGASPLAVHEPDLAEYRSPYFDYHFGSAAQDGDTEQFLHTISNLTVLRSHVREYKQGTDQPLTLADFVTFVDTYRAAGEKLLNTSPYHSAQKAVQLLTAYGSKGLEFEHVFVIDTVDEAWGMKARGKSSNITLPKNLAYIRQAGKNKDERKRLLYVALTRAKLGLYITSSGSSYSGAATTRLEFLEETDDQSPNISPLMPAYAQNIIESDLEAPALETMTVNWQTRHVAGPNAPDLRELLLPQMEHFQISATHINTFTDLVFAGPEHFLLNTVLKFPKSPSADGQYGNAMHETLEWVHHYVRKHDELPEVEQVQATFATKLREKGLSQTEYERRLTKGQQDLGVFLPQWWPNFNPANEHERPFRDEGSFVGDAHLNGNLDQMLIDREDKIIVVTDFKTGRPHNRWTNDIKLHRYKQQLLFYKLLVENSHTYRDYKVEAGRLVFVEPDEDNHIQELVLDYKADEVERMKALIGAVWRRVKTLDLPDVSGFDKSYKGVIDFENWLIENI